MNVCGHICAKEYIWRSKGNVWKSVLSTTWITVTQPRHGSCHFHRLSDPTGPRFVFSYSYWPTRYVVQYVVLLRNSNNFLNKIIYTGCKKWYRICRKVSKFLREKILITRNLSPKYYVNTKQMTGEFVADKALDACLPLWLSSPLESSPVSKVMEAMASLYRTN